MLKKSPTKLKLSKQDPTLFQNSSIRTDSFLDKNIISILMIYTV